MNNKTNVRICRKNLIFILLFFSACNNNQTSNNKDISEVAGNKEVLNFMKTFEGRGDLSDTSIMVSPQDALKRFKIPGDLALDLILSEPEITQPVFITFDPQGRLWVVQYNQYPYPEGLKVLSMDQHIRAKFDKEPPAPPSNAKGADKITMFEDTDNNGTFDKSTDVITGLNLATSIAFGRGQIWVLNPPYLLAYPDPDHNGIPDGEPVVHLKGFGIEDTHAVANNLRFGPDGWLYGAQGSTCIANISSEVSKNVHFDGQAIWRYHPETKIFEVFAEGGGNTFDVEIDSKGRLYSGDNGTSRGQYYKQDGYFIKNLGKHGDYTNPFAFGHLSNMELQGEETRFTHAFIRYEGNSLPQRYNDHMIAINPLQSYVQLTRFEQKGSTFKTIDEEKLMQTDDHWFRPVDIVSGPDGNVYIADWYDSRISHVDPRDTWNKSSGRIYRLRNGSRPGRTEGDPGADRSVGTVGSGDLNKLSDDELITLLTNQNIWYREQALLVLGDRKNSALLPKLMQMLNDKDGQIALEAFWAINLSGGFNDEVAKACLIHPDPYIRMWSVRITGDDKKVSPEISKALAQLAATEIHPEVRSQLASTAKRLPGQDALPIIKNLLNGDDSTDPDIPLQLWWALESVSESNRNELVSMFRDSKIWNRPVMMKTLLSRLIQRYILAGGEENISATARLFTLAPSDAHAAILFNGLQEGLRGRDITELSPTLVNALKPYKHLFREETLAIDLRLGKKDALQKAMKLIADPNAKLQERLAYIKILGEINQPGSVNVLLDVMENSESPAIQQAAILSLQNYNLDEIGKRVAIAYPDRLRNDYNVREAALSLFASREKWARLLLNAISNDSNEKNFIAHTIDKSDVPDHIVRQLKLLNSEEINRISERLWPDVRMATPAEKNAAIASINKIMKAVPGNPANGRPVFIAKCGSCHKLFNEGRNIGPDLTGYDRKNLTDLLNNIVDPSAYIREGYGNWHVITNDGRQVAGMLRSKTDKSVTIQPYTGEPVVLSASKIKSMEQMKSSMMPEKLLDDLSEKQKNDLFTYLMKQ